MFHNDGFFAKLSPKNSFFLGIGAMLVLFFVIGFFALLGIVIKDKKTAGNSSPSVADAAKTDEPSDQPAPKEIQLPPITDKDWIRGKRDAKIILVGYSDLECPFCKDFHATLARLIKEYSNDAAWVYRHFPLTRHPKAPKEAEAAECAGELGGNDKFWAFTERLFEITPSNNGLDLAQLPQIAQDVGLNRNKFQECLDSGRHAAKVQNQTNEALAAGGNGTPYTVILYDNQKIPINGVVPYEQLKSFVDSALKK